MDTTSVCFTLTQGHSNMSSQWPPMQMENELENYHKTNTEQELQLQELRQKLRAIEAELHRAVQRNYDFTIVMNRYRSDLFSCMDHLQDPKKLKEGIKV